MDYIILIIRSKTLQKVQKQISNLFGRKYLENLFLKSLNKAKMAEKNSYFYIYLIAIFISTTAEESVSEIKIIYISKHLYHPVDSTEAMI